MSVLGGNPLLLGGADAAFTTQRSVRLRSSASAYFNRTFTSAGNQQKWTWSSWHKIGDTSLGAILLQQYTDTANQSQARFGGSAGQSRFYDLVASSFVCDITWSPVHRDPSGWYHVVFVVDTTQAINTDRIKFYVNGERITATASATWPALNSNLRFNGNTPHFMNQNGAGSSFGDGYRTEINFIDGQALTPSSFGEYDSVRNTQWKPKAYTGTYGTNGFYLKFADNSAATAAALGKDSSGNGNNWTPNNISLTAGVTYDSMTDVPTLTSETASNFATMSPIIGTTNLSNGNLYLTGAAAYRGGYGSIPLPASGQWYWEGLYIQATNNLGFGLAVINPQAPIAPLAGTGAIGFNNAGQWWIESSTATTGNPSWTATTVVGMRYDASTGEFSYTSNGTTWTTIVTGTARFTDGRIWVPACWAFATNDQLTLNFGQRPFTYTPPTGFKALNTFNLPDGAVTSSDDYHKVYTYTGNGGGLQVGEIQKPASLFNLDRSLRFRASASAYLNRTAGTPTNANIWTLSGWIKRGALATRSTVLCGGTNNVNYVCFNDSATNDYFGLTYANTPSQLVNVMTNQSFKDPAAWNHFMVVYDSTSATTTITGTSTDRVRLYINGVQVTSFSATTPPAQNTSVTINAAASLLNLGRRNLTTPDSYFDGYLADVYFIDGQALTPTDFGAYDGNYYWTPKAYTGTYGTNGFHLEFEDFSAATAAAIGKDTSGQGNNWTPNNINLTTPANTNASWDSMVDVPTQTSTDVANFATLSPIDKYSAITVSNGNLYTDGAGSAGTALSKGANSTLSVTSGKWYWEVTQNVGSGAYECRVGIWTDSAASNNIESSSTGRYFYRNAGANLTRIYNGTSFIDYSSYYGTFTDGDVLMFALDVDSGKMWLGKNGTWFNNAGGAKSPDSGTNPDWTSLPIGSIFAHAANYQTTAQNSTLNFGQRPFKYTPPANFKSINSFNIAEVTGDLESPDFVWIKSRSAGTNHALFNSVTGVGKYLSSNLAAAEVTDVNSLIQFNKNGFLIGNSAVLNTLSATYVAAAWKTGGSVVTNNAGSISSQVRANATSGISIITYNGTAANATVGHGLGVTPAVIMVKPRVNATPNWRVWHKSLGTTDSYLGLNQTALVATSTSVFNSQSPTTFGIGTDPATNSASAMLAICFAEIAGFSKFTSYAANASSTDGPFVTCGFSPRWLMIKRATGASGTGGWIMYDTARSTYNIMGEYLFAEGAAGGSTLAAIDVTANGFKIRSNNVHLNQTAGDVYIVMAFAEHPFKYSLAR